MRFKVATLVTAISIVLSGCADSNANKINENKYDLVISNGRVIDPASNTDKVMNIGITDGTIVTLSNASLAGEKEISAKGKIVSPGFIDLHSHNALPFGSLLQIRDGVTSSLELESGAFPVTDYGKFIKDKPYLNYGASVAHLNIRLKVIEDLDLSWIINEDGALVPGATFVQEATVAQIEQMRGMLHEGLDQGGLGIGLLLDYLSQSVNEAELRMIFEVAAERNAPIWAHIRRGVNGDIQPLHDVLDLAIDTGAPLHIAHINANAMGEIGNWMKVIDEANKKGADITMEVFPYTAGSTSISADVFNRNWKEIFGISYENVQWAETGEYFTADTWYEMRKSRPDGMVIHHYMQEDWLLEGMKHPDMMIATDAMPAMSEDLKSAPNGAGSFTRILSHYVRDTNALTLNEAIAKSTYYPARRLQNIAPMFEKKGRIQEGADADILVYDLDSLNSNAVYTDPYLHSTGYSYIIVNGSIVVEGEELTLATPGQQLLSTN